VWADFVKGATFIQRISLETAKGVALMSKGNKTLCKWDKDDIKDNLKELKKIVAQPRYVCKKCGRAAKDDDLLCKPEEL
jgi:hypothetical protein